MKAITVELGGMLRHGKETFEVKWVQTNHRHGLNGGSGNLTLQATLVPPKEKAKKGAKGEAPAPVSEAPAPEAPKVEAPAAA